MNIKAGDRVRRSDARENSIPAFAAMRGTVKFVCGDLAVVRWDCDSEDTDVPLAFLTVADDNHGTHA